MRKTTQLRQLINSGDPEILMEAHNGMSAKIVEEAGFKGIWASGLTISASMGVRDNNELSWTQVADVIDFMSESTSIPILLDGDTGYGNFNNARRLVKKLEQIQIAGVCIEDKCFPKTNSFIQGEKQPLANVEEFCGKIKAMKDTQSDDDFVVISRVEAFIAGWGLKEALKRAESYRRAGTDAILIHSKRSDSLEIEAFIKEWAGRLPLVVVPTTYYSVPLNKFKELAVSLVIWANHNFRAAVEAMQRTSRMLYQKKDLIEIQEQIVPVKEIFRLQGAEELKVAEQKYLPSTIQSYQGVILATDRSHHKELPKDSPKALLELKGQTILSSQIQSFNKLGIKDITVIRGFAKDLILPTNFKVIDNDNYTKMGSLYSLFLAQEALCTDTVVCNADCIFKDFILDELLVTKHDITLVVDAETDLTEGHPYVKTTLPYSKKLFSDTVQLSFMSNDLEPEARTGQFIGLWKMTKMGTQIVKKVLEVLSERDDFGSLTISDLFNYICTESPIYVLYSKGAWLDFKSIVESREGNQS